MKWFYELGPIERLGLTIIAGSLAIFIWYMAYLCVEDISKKCVATEPIIRIGGCSWSGECGVATEHWAATDNKPVLGKPVCVKWSYGE